MRYTSDEPFSKKAANKSSTGSSSTSSSRKLQPIKEISHFSKDSEEPDNRKGKQNIPQENLSKTYASMIKNILTTNQDNNKLNLKKPSEEKSKSQDSFEEIKNEEKFCEATSSQRAIGKKIIVFRISGLINLVLG